MVRIAEVAEGYHVSEHNFTTLAEGFVETMEADRAALLSRYVLLDVAHKVVGWAVWGCRR